MGPLAPWIRRRYDPLSPREVARFVKRLGTLVVIPTRWNLRLFLKEGDEILVEPVLSEVEPLSLTYSILWVENRPSLADFPHPGKEDTHAIPGRIRPVEKRAVA